MLHYVIRETRVDTVKTKLWIYNIYPILLALVSAYLHSLASFNCFAVRSSIGFLQGIRIHVCMDVCMYIRVRTNIDGIMYKCIVLMTNDIRHP